MKKMIAIALLLVSGTASAFDSATCVLEKKAYESHDHDNEHYKLIYSEVVSRKSAVHREKATLADAAHPVIYQVDINGNQMEGMLMVKVDQPGPVEYGSSTIDKPLVIKLEDYYNGGKNEYELRCQVISGTSNVVADRGTIGFKADSVYSLEEQAAITKAVNKACPALLPERLAYVSEEMTIVEKRRVDQNMFDSFFTSTFSFSTQEGEGVMGTLVVKSDRSYNGEFDGIEVSVDPARVCSW